MLGVNAESLCAVLGEVRVGPNTESQECSAGECTLGPGETQRFLYLVACFSHASHLSSLGLVVLTPSFPSIHCVPQVPWKNPPQNVWCFCEARGCLCGPGAGVGAEPRVHESPHLLSGAAAKDHQECPPGRRFTVKPGGASSGRYLHSRFNRRIYKRPPSLATEWKNTLGPEL